MTILTPPRATPNTHHRHRWLVLAAVASGLLLVTLDNSVLYTALPTLSRDLGATSAQALWIINAYPLVMAGLLLGAGTLGDRLGHRRTLLAGMVVFGAASLLAAFSPTAATLIGARAVLAVGAALMMPATLALIRTTFDDPRERNLAVAIWGSVSIVGAALGPIVGGLLLEWFWWGSVFLVNVPVVVAALVVTVRVAPREAPDPGVRWDAWSSVLALVALGGLVALIKELAQVGRSWPLCAVLAAAAIAGGTLFARRQRRIPHPLLDVALFRSPGLSAGVIGAALASFVVAGTQLVTTQRFQLAEGFTPLQAGLLVVCVAVGAIPTSLLAGRVLHRTGPRPLLLGGFALTALGTGLALVATPHGWPWLAPALALVGLGVGPVMSTASAMVIGNAPRRQAGMASSVEEVSFELGSLTAVAVLGSVFTTLTVTAGIADAYSTVIAMASAVAVLGLVAVALLLRGRNEAPTGGH